MHRNNSKSNSFDTSSLFEVRTSLISLYEKFNPLTSNTPLKTPESIIKSRGWVNHSDLSEYNKRSNTLGNIVLVDNDFKLLFGLNYAPMFPEAGQLKANKTYEYFVDKYHDGISSIKYSEISGMTTIFTSGCLLIKFKLKDKNEYTFLVKQDDNKEIRSLLDKISDLLSGEFIQISRRNRIRKFPSYHRFWGGNWEDVQYVKEHYNNSDLIYLTKFETHILNMKKKEPPLLIFDIGAGKGRLAEKLISLALTKGIPLHYLLLEPDESQCKIASERLDELNNKYSEKFHFKTTIINSSIEEFTKSELYQSNVGKVDGIISSGGPLNTDIVSFEAAHENLSTIHNLLCEGGVLLASGLTELLVTKKTFEKYDMNIINMSEKAKTENKTELLQFYVLEKCNPIKNEPSLIFRK